MFRHFQYFSIKVYLFVDSFSSHYPSTHPDNLNIQKQKKRIKKATKKKRKRHTKTQQEISGFTDEIKETGHSARVAKSAV